MEAMKRLIISVIISLFMLSVTRAKSLRIRPGETFDRSTINSYSLTEIILLRNSIFANRGYVFKCTALNDYFSSQGWYSANKHFTFSMLSTEEQKLVQYFNRIEKDREEELKKKLTGVKSCSKIYAVSIKEIEPMPGRSRINRSLLSRELGEEIFIPSFISVSVEKKSRSFIDTQIAIHKKQDDRYYYWSACVDRGVVRKLYRCYFDPNMGDVCGTGYYFNGEGKLQFVRGAVPNTVIGYEWYLQYIGRKLAWAVVTVQNAATQKIIHKKKFYF